MWRTSVVLLCCCSLGRFAGASVIVVTNRTDAVVSFRLASEVARAARPRECKVESGDCLPFTLAGPAQMSFDSAGHARSYRVVPNGLYYFSRPPKGQLDVGQIGLSAPEPKSNGKPAIEATLPIDDPAASPEAVIIPVKILYDHEEMMAVPAWESQMRKRFDEASRIFRKQCFVEFRIVAVDSWRWDTSIKDLAGALGAFERAVNPAPARLAIGFMGHRVGMPPDGHLGGTRGPLNTHVLIRERAIGNTEPECLELLVHELGHFLGAAHSPEKNSVMRAALGNRQARFTRFRIVFDPLNTLAMCLVNQELMIHPLAHFGEIGAGTRAELDRLYLELQRANPADPTAAVYLRRLGGPSLDVSAEQPSPR